MKAILFICEAGLALIDESWHTLYSKKFGEDSVYLMAKLLEGESIKELVELLQLAKHKGIDTILVHDEKLFPAISQAGLAVEAMDSSMLAEIHNERLNLIVKAELADDIGAAKELVRSFAIEKALRRIREYASKPDRHVAQSINSIEEIDKTSNLLWGRLKEWYSLHFPELQNFIEEPEVYAQIVLKIGRRELFRPERLDEYNFLEEKQRAILQACKESKGGEIRDEDLAIITQLAQAYLNLENVRKRMSEHVNKTMQLVAPNISKIIGPLVGAKLIAKAGSLERLASLPASTIQVLGAEKALFRSLKTGTKPPKHGILFQHPHVHSSAKWQRGKIARILANAIAIAARIDLYRGEIDPLLPDKIERRIMEIKARYSESSLKTQKERRYGRKSRKI